MRTLNIVLSAVVVIDTFGENSFNFDINYRVQDNIQSFLQKITNAGKLPFLQLQTGMFPIAGLNASISGWDADSLLFVNIKRLLMEDVVQLAIGFWNKFFVSVFNQNFNNLYSNLPYNLYLTRSLATNHIISENRAVDSNGRVTDRLLGYTNLDCTTRAWYTTAQSRMVPSWTAPFILISGFPAIAYSIPLVNLSYAGRTSGFVGVISVFVHLSQITNYLEKAYGNSSNSVFIVEKSSGFLIASSVGAKTHRVTSSGVNVGPFLCAVVLP